MDVSFILDDLNDEQRQAVTSESKKLLVLAGAGSGKTKVLVHRIAWLIKALGYSTHSVLAVTFTNKAASEMTGRIELILEQPIPELWCGTFHSISNKILRRHYKEAGLERDFSILDSDDQLRIIKRVLKRLEIDDEQWPAEKVRWQINNWKDDGLRPNDIDDKGDFNLEILKKIYLEYGNYLDSENLLDFGELILRSYELIKNNAELQRVYRSKFQNILIDEFQDTNTIQFKWINNLVGERSNVTAVGDDDQSIYGWRGAKIENINKFAKGKETEMVRLEQNYRSTENILNAANAVIGKNSNRLGKKLWTAGNKGELIEVFEAYSEQEEASFISDKVIKISQEGDQYKDIAVLYRSNAQSRVIEEFLLRENLPYVIYGGVRFYERLEIKNVLSYLRLCVNFSDNSAFERAIGAPTRGIGEKTLAMIREHATQSNTSLFAASKQLLTNDLIKGKGGSSLGGFISFIEKASETIPEMPPHEFVEMVINQSGLIEHHLKERGEKGKIRIENINELISAVKSFDTLNKGEDLSEFGSVIAAFLSSVSLDMGETQAHKADDAVQLMTLHSAKGLEFKYVFMVGMEESIFPHSRSSENISELEEERRLCYVGITRARAKLHLTYAEFRRLYGQDSYNPPSRFINEIPNDHLEFVRPRQNYSTSYYGTVSQIKEEHNDFEFNLGDNVRHKTFGDGVVLSMEGSGDAARIQVNFYEVGTKWLVAAYANLQKI
ncbi:MAG: DNA helicase II [Proteobacteria bacterium]|uniref:DNA 3'-5' helicase n=1 Tax=SAR86 cluster bacterium TaxID=2030880 RepID=A0A937LLL3_9GAMM|nr:DNA helicase II [SAR86 cluster bacterium]MBL6820254.1 DNA helicase II [SAR86 cluster bacterium]MDA0345039.1 DNA helicase II [Pseudomonadota bacterium]MDA0899957.1 DNA helicase II [Pseudomonadota bacterium]MDA1056298.1 DNA helicase II [Pseudomonadota bacterium]